MKVSEVIGDDARVFTKSDAARKPRISIITPTYRRNAEGLLAACLQSALDQTFTDFEHIIVDDGSSDGTEETVLRLAEQDDRIVYVRHDRNSGLPAVRTNEGILRARGEAVAFLFDDNVFERDFLESAWTLLESGAVDVVHGHVAIPQADGTAVMLGTWPASLDVMRGRNTIANGGVLIRRDFFDRYGLYDPHIAARRLCDWELWIRSLWLGAQFRRLPKLVAEERGTISPNSLGNTVALEWKVSQAYLHDTRQYADRARRLTPAMIAGEDVLDPARIKPYVRDAQEWTDFAALIYRPFLERHGIDFDPSLLSNRAESVDPDAGWNPSWALHHRRFRALLLTNTLNALASALLEGVRSIPGAIVFNVPEWAMSLLEPGALDVVLILDGGASFIPEMLEAHRAAGTHLVYISAYGVRHVPSGVPFNAVPISSNPHLVNTAELPPAYFPSPGYGRPKEAGEGVRLQQQTADLVVNMAWSKAKSQVSLPPLVIPALAQPGSPRQTRIAYCLDAADEPASETIPRPVERSGGLQSAKTLASLVITRPGTDIIVERRDLDTLPTGELIGLGCLASTHDVNILAVGGEPLPQSHAFERSANAEDWWSWFANLVRVARLRQRLKVPRHELLTVDIYINSELYAGSEVYGLLIAKSLAELGIRARIRIPERNIYAGDTAVLDTWLAGYGLPPVVRAPFLPSVLHSIYRPEAERENAVAKLQAFISADPPDLLLATGHNPQLADVRHRPPLFMAFFSLAAYEQTWLSELQGQLHGIMSDNEWALRPTAAVIGAPGRVIPSAVDGTGGGEIERVTGDACWPVRIVVAGTLQPRKRQLEAVKAVGLLRRRGYDVELHLYGLVLEVMKDYGTLVAEEIVAQDLAAYVTQHGFVEDGSEITRNNDIVLCGSTDESLPQGLIFQMYQGLIGVAALCGGIDEYLIDGKTGYLTTDPSPAGVANALARALDDRSNWRNVAGAARSLIRQRCNTGHVTASLLDLFDEGLALSPWRYRAMQAEPRPPDAALDAPHALEQQDTRERVRVAPGWATTKVRDIVGWKARVTTAATADYKPDISIVTPTYRRNVEGLLLKCLHSALDQTFTNFEHIIIDDGSTDGTEDVVLDLCERDPRIVYVRHDTNCGLPAVRVNEAISRARGRAIAFLFDDNVFEPNFLAEAYNLLNESGADVVHGEVDMPRANGANFVIGGAPLTLDLLRGMNTIANAGVLVRRDFFDRFGAYDPHLAARRLCDWELWVRALSLGARFRHLPRIVAEEGGVLSPTSLENTVAIDWKAVYGYLQDTSAFGERARRLAPSAILDVDVLDTAVVRPYVRDETEWRTVIDRIYRPYLDRHRVDFDPGLYTNRVASTDPARGWNPEWAMHRRRFRVLVLANAVPSLAATVIEAARAIPGAVVMSCPEWHLSALEPGHHDLIVLVDGASPFIAGFLDAHRRAGARVAYLSFYGEQTGPVPFDLPNHADDPHIVGVFGKGLYVPQPGYAHRGEQVAAARALRDGADMVVTVGVPKDGEVGLPRLPLPSLTCRVPAGARIAYRLRSDSDSNVTERISRDPQGGTGRVSSESLASLVLSRAGAEILVEPADLSVLPVADRLGLGCLAARRNVSIARIGDHPTPPEDPEVRRMVAAQWEGWFANLMRVMRLQQRLGSAPRARLTVDIYINSELYSGSEAYGLGLARSLDELGVRVRVRIPEKSVYGGQHIAVNDWLAEQALPPATRAPFIQGSAWTVRSPEERAASLDALTSFIAADPPDLIIASAYIPHLANLVRRPPLFMALFSPAAYDQRELISLRGRVDGLLSDSAWALDPSAAVIGAPGRVIRSTVFGQGGEEIDRIAAQPRSAPIRIALAGTLQIRKRQLEAVKAVAILRRRGFDVQLNLYGYALDLLQDYIDRIDAAIEAEGLKDHVRRHGFVEDGSEITRNNEMVLSASTDESLPQGLLFQMFKGLVGVAVVSGGIDEVVADGRSGYLTHDPAPRSIADALARAIEDRDRWREVAENARRTIFAECNTAHTTGRLLDLLEEGVALRPPMSQIPEAANTADVPAIATLEASPVAVLTLDAPPAPRERDLSREQELLASSQFFSRDWYLHVYPDVAADGEDPVLHYLTCGAAEGRDPGPHFSTDHYLTHAPDVAEAGLNPLVHYLDEGRAEGRSIEPSSRSEALPAYIGSTDESTPSHETPPIELRPSGQAKLAFKATGQGMCGANIALGESGFIRAALSSSVRPDLVLRRSEAAVDETGLLRLRWPAIERSAGQAFLLHLDVQRPGREGTRRGLLPRLLRKPRVELREIVYEEIG